MGKQYRRIFPLIQQMFITISLTYYGSYRTACCTFWSSHTKWFFIIIIYCILCGQIKEYKPTNHKQLLLVGKDLERKQLWLFRKICKIIACTYHFDCHRSENSLRVAAGLWSHASATLLTTCGCKNICSNFLHIIVSVKGCNCIVYEVNNLYPLITSC